MGYCYGRNEHGTMSLCCDNCGTPGSRARPVRKRTCPFRVRYAEGGSLPYCYPAALCSACYATHKATLHATCRAGAEASTAKELHRKARLDAGGFEVRTAWGDWHERVPKGSTGVRFVGLGVGGAPVEVFRLLPKEVYDPGAKRWLDDYPEATAWAGPNVRTKEVPVAELLGGLMT